ncbi:Os04g0351800 [Oryza sativa Japonica Group]|uniref:Os04g0351800 protein n=2 Tax=Oryza sativa TaxID=4530 RepID=A0A0P0W8X5_ORYSJ|nr:hypothetical protein EE612_023287 [Oryza sativa]BAS88730.1 Os04g0351800 [Oryza sativa Japonica Group]
MLSSALQIEANYDHSLTTIMAAATMANVALLLLFLVQVMSVIGGGAAAARPLLLQADGGAVIGMVTEMLGGAKSRGNLRTHCC